MLNDCIFYYLNEAGSSNEEIKILQEKNIDNSSIALYLNKQTQGKGRGANKWLSKEGDFTCSFLLNEEFEVQFLGQINVVITVAILLAIRDNLKLNDIKLKWPNDLYLYEKKLGGILLESKVQKNFANYIIAGVGLNIISSPKGLRYKTTKIIDYKATCDSKQLFLSIYNSIKKYFVLWKKNKFNSIKQIWLEYSKDLGKEDI